MIFFLGGGLLMEMSFANQALNTLSDNVVSELDNSPVGTSAKHQEGNPLRREW